MGPHRLLSVFLLSLLLISNPVFGQQSPQSPQVTAPDQSALLLHKSLALLAPRGLATDVTLTGTARRIAGSDDESGSATLKAHSTGASRVELNFSSGQRTEVHNASPASSAGPAGSPIGSPVGSWSGPDRAAHPIAFHNLLTEPAWFFPAFAIARSLSAAGHTVAYLGHETHNEQAVEHFALTQVSPFPENPGPVSFEHLSKVYLFLDSSTLLPTALSFNIHPDNNALLDIPVEVRFSDYRAVSGVVAGLQTGSAASPQVPFHIQKFLNNTLTLDFQADSVTFNSGLSNSDFVPAMESIPAASGPSVPPPVAAISHRHLSFRSDLVAAAF